MKIRLIVVLVCALKECRSEVVGSWKERGVVALLDGVWLSYVVGLRLERVHGL